MIRPKASSVVYKLRFQVPAKLSKQRTENETKLVVTATVKNIIGDHTPMTFLIVDGGNVV